MTTQKFRQSASTRGFTIIELMVTVAIAVVLLGIAAPSFQGVLMKYRLDAATRSLYDDLLAAREESRDGQNAVTICASDDGASCNATDWTKGHIVFRDPANKGKVDAGEQLVVRGEAPRVGVKIDGVQLSDNSAFARGYLQFNEATLDLTGGVEFTLCYGSTPKRTIRVTRNGAINTTKGTGACS
jgi:type IV fimbrial biogenesis protein FimT